MPSEIGLAMSTILIRGIACIGVMSSSLLFTTQVSFIWNN